MPPTQLKASARSKDANVVADSAAPDEEEASDSALDGLSLSPAKRKCNILVALLGNRAMSQLGSETAARLLVAEVGQPTAATTTPGTFAVPLRGPASRERESADRCRA
jgi:hypothetical protein